MALRDVENKWSLTYVLLHLTDHGWANCAHIKNYILVSEKGAGMLLKIPVGQVLLKDANLVCTN